MEEKKKTRQTIRTKPDASRASLRKAFLSGVRIMPAAREKKDLETLVVSGFPVLFQEFPAESLVLPVEDGGGLLVVFPLFPFADDAFFFNHALEALDRLLEVFGIVDNDMCHK